jgi:FlaG/FlaF family flagellin (archaellin)
MRLKKGGNRGERGVSTVVGVVLMVALAIITAAVVGGYVLQVEETATQEPAPEVNWEYEYDGSANELTIRHAFGEAIDVEEIYVRYEAEDDELRWDNTSASWAMSSTSDNGEVGASDEFVVSFDNSSDARNGIRIYWRTQGTNPEEQSSARIGGWELDG